MFSSPWPSFVRLPAKEYSFSLFLHLFLPSSSSHNVKLSIFSRHLFVPYRVVFSSFCSFVHLFEFPRSHFFSFSLAVSVKFHLTSFSFDSTSHLFLLLSIIPPDVSWFIFPTSLFLHFSVFPSLTLFAKFTNLAFFSSPLSHVYLFFPHLYFLFLLFLCPSSLTSLRFYLSLSLRQIPP